MLATHQKCFWGYARECLLLPDSKNSRHSRFHSLQRGLGIMGPPESAVWEFIDKVASAAKAGNCLGSCKCCKLTRTQAPSWWWEHLYKQCNGSNNPELLPHAKTSAAQYFAKAACKAELKARKHSGKQHSGKQQSLIISRSSCKLKLTRPSHGESSLMVCL